MANVKEICLPQKMNCKSHHFIYSYIVAQRIYLFHIFCRPSQTNYCFRISQDVECSRSKNKRPLTPCFRLKNGSLAKFCVSLWETIYLPWSNIVRRENQYFESLQSFSVTKFSWKSRKDWQKLYFFRGLAIFHVLTFFSFRTWNRMHRGGGFERLKERWLKKSVVNMAYFFSFDFISNFTHTLPFFWRWGSSLHRATPLHSNDQQKASVFTFFSMLKSF